MFCCPANVTKKLCVVFTSFTLSLLCYIISRESLMNHEATSPDNSKTSFTAKLLSDYQTHRAAYSSEKKDSSLDPFPCIRTSSGDSIVAPQISTTPDGVKSSVLGHVGTVDYAEEIRDAGILDGPLGTSTRTNILDLKPIDFLKHYKNPCWKETIPNGQPYANNTFAGYYTNFVNYGIRLSRLWNRRMKKGRTWRLRCLPYVYVIGMPKCGTTDLYKRLLLHPDMVPGLVKEPHWWTRKRFERHWARSQVPAPFSDYVDLFDGAAHCIQTQHLNTHHGPYHHMITVEASASTLWDNDQWARHPGNANLTEPRYVTAHFLHHLQPDAKFLVILRDPTERLYSDYLYFVKSQNKSAVDFHQRVEVAMDWFQTCLLDYSLRACVYDRSHRNISKCPVRLHVGIYHIFIQDWLSVYPRDQFHFLRLSDYSQETDYHMAAVFDFLGLGSIPRSVRATLDTLPTFNKRRVQDRSLGSMLDHTRELLDRFYIPFNRHLSRILRDDRYMWKNSVKRHTP